MNNKKKVNITFGLPLIKSFSIESPAEKVSFVRMAIAKKVLRCGRKSCVFVIFICYHLLTGQ